MRPTLRDVAREAGVSTMTVSNVLNRRRGRASPATVTRVLAAVDALGYVPHAPARALSRASSGLVAVVHPPGPRRGSAPVDQHDAVMVAAIERWVTASGRHLLVYATTDPVETVTSLRTWSVDGAILLGAFEDQAEALRDGCDVPLVFVDAHGATPRSSSVGVDDHRGGWLAGEAFAEEGHRRVALVAPPHTRDGVVRRRVHGCVAALRQHDLDVAEVDVHTCDAVLEEAETVGRRLAASRARPTAVFATADVIAAGVVKGLLAADVDVPREVSVVGFDDDPLCRLLTPELTTIRQDLQTKARTAVDLLLAEVAPAEGEGSGPTEHVTLEVELVRRGTLGPPPPSTPGTRRCPGSGASAGTRT
jgi:LacI family transcriptional regulator